MDPAWLPVANIENTSPDIMLFPAGMLMSPGATGHPPLRSSSVDRWSVMISQHVDGCASRHCNIWAFLIILSLKSMMLHFYEG